VDRDPSVVEVMGQRVIYFSAGLITRTIQQGHLIARTQVTVGLPNDARYVRCFDSVREGHVGLVFESKEWIPAREGGDIPEHQIVFQNAC